ncbi:hypothetical protein LJY18_11175 [Pseudomonas sp. MMS21-TM103]|uniref:hypothetical protein n=1 Tax=Pseudomonas sp. MMS21 TM103 TaxID=2886506 RepID=UPI001EDE36C8|nr:hypothetical protein [Pseudomonas sp. MMS21 TM103]MCG4453857.1 hypothetical protein [Pseudomonas sp. MMS21 TM103]
MPALLQPLTDIFRVIGRVIFMAGTGRIYSASVLAGASASPGLLRPLQIQLVPRAIARAVAPG